MAPKIHPNWSKSQLLADFWHPVVDILVFLSGARKLSIFEVASERQQFGKVGPSVAKDPQSRERPAIFASRGPQAGHARDQKVERGQLARGKRARGKEGKWKSGKKVKLESKVGKKEKEEGSNTPVGQRLGDFSYCFLYMLYLYTFGLYGSEGVRDKHHTLHTLTGNGILNAYHTTFSGERTCYYHVPLSLCVVCGFGARVFI